MRAQHSLCCVCSIDVVFELAYQVRSVFKHPIVLLPATMAGAAFSNQGLSLAMTDSAIDAWNHEVEQAEARHMSLIDKVNRGLLAKLVMPEDVLIQQKYGYMPKMVQQILWEESHGYGSFAGERANANARAKAKTKIKKGIQLKRRPFERAITWHKRQQARDDERLRAMLTADPTIPRTPDQNLELPGLRCPASSSYSSSSKH